MKSGRRDDKINYIRDEAGAVRNGKGSGGGGTRGVKEMEVMKEDILIRKKRMSLSGTFETTLIYLPYIDSG